ncbi:hypothetical protein [Marinicella rhabdoformis]|uniref:hypothetical protein n=1 Tax=Marinicella rhabdoformis TaxID=2580566 RepID=UPI0012AEDD35|nr:hypothetical protein [Marinicella rhabdoformis]
MNTIKLLFISVALMSLMACGEDQGPGAAANEVAKLDTNTPDGAFKAVVASLRSNDLKTMIQTSMSEEQYNELVAEFEKGKATQFSQSDEMQFQQMMGMLTSEGAEDTLYAMAAPQLEQARAFLPMALMMGKDQISQMVQSNGMLDQAQQESAIKVGGAVIDWVGENDILSEEVTKGAIAAAVATAKALDMKSLNEVKDMSFDQALEKGAVVLGGVKNIMGAYGISMDDMLDSVEVSNVQVSGETATMDMTMELFGEEITQAVNMVQKNGKWVSEK